MLSNQKNEFASFLRRFRLMSRYWILLITKVLLQNVASVHFLIDINFTIPINDRCFTTGANSVPNHDVLRILVVFVDGWGTESSCELISFILVIARLFHRKQLYSSYVKVIFETACAHSWAAELLKLILLEYKFLGRLSNCFTIDASLTRDLFHRNLRISND